jgi:c(7)-type cytochrome triheme protein
MRRRSARAAGLSVGLAVLLLGGGTGTGQAPADFMPPDFVMKRSENSPGPVTFSHAQHWAKVGKCTRCHAKTFKMKRDQSGPITLESHLERKFCGTCHDGTTTMAGAVVFASDACDRCHAL